MVLVHLNICSLRNKVHEVTRIYFLNNIHALPLSEMHLGTTFDDSELADRGYIEGTGTDMVVDLHSVFRNTFQPFYQKIL